MKQAKSIGKGKTAAARRVMAQPKAAAKTAAQATPAQPKAAAVPVRVKEAGGSLVIDVAPAMTKDLPALQKAGGALTTIADAAQREGAYNFLRKTLRPRISFLRDIFTRIKRDIAKAGDSARASEKELLAPYITLDDRIEKAILAFDETQAARRREEERQRREAEEAALKAQQEQATAAATATDATDAAETADDLRAAIEALRESVADSSLSPADKVPLIREIAGLKRQLAALEQGQPALPLTDAAPAVPAVIVPPAPTKTQLRQETKGQTVTYRAEITNVAMLVAAVATGKAALAAIEPEKLIQTHPWLNAQAREHGAELSIPGVRAVPDVSIR